MREIVLGRTGFKVLVDDQDYAELSRHTWTPQHHGRTVYAVESYGCCGGAGRRMHRLIMGALPGMQVDHKDGDGLNNTRTNLRIADSRQNQGNRRKQSGASRFKGVCRTTRGVPWRAVIKENGVQKHLGSYRTEEEAAIAYDDAARRVFGAFAAVNFPRAGERSAHSVSHLTL
jgi:hypothetical protein